MDEDVTTTEQDVTAALNEGGLDPGEAEDGAIPFDPEPTETDGTEETEIPAAAQPDPYQERFDKQEQRIAQLEAALHAAAQERQAPRAIIPEALRKPHEQWTTKDLQEWNQYTIDQRLRTITEEQQWRGRLSAAALGAGNDFDTIVEQRLYNNPQIQADPTSLNFVRNMGPLDKYMLGLVHELSAKAAGDPVRVIQALRNALGARMAGAQDIQKSVTSAARKTQMGLIRGGKSGGAAPIKDAWDLDEKSFAALARKGS